MIICGICNDALVFFVGTGKAGSSSIIIGEWGVFVGICDCIASTVCSCSANPGELSNCMGLPAHSLHHLPRLPTRISGGSRHRYCHPRGQAATTACDHEGGGPVRDLPGPTQGVRRLGKVQVPIDIGRVWGGTTG